MYLMLTPLQAVGLVGTRIRTGVMGIKAQSMAQRIRVMEVQRIVVWPLHQKIHRTPMGP